MDAQFLRRLPWQQQLDIASFAGVREFVANARYNCTVLYKVGDDLLEHPGYVVLHGEIIHLMAGNMSVLDFFGEEPDASPNPNLVTIAIPVELALAPSYAVALALALATVSALT